MLQQAFFLLFLILSFIFSLFSVSTADSNVYVQCSQLNFTSTTPYESNVNSLFTSLIDSALVYNFNKFETSPQSDTVYGLFQCRGDVSSKNCNDCVANSINQLKTTCPMSSGGEIQLEACFVKYDDTPFFGVVDKLEVCKRCGPSIGYNSDVLNRIDGALAYLVRGNGEYFRGGDFGSVQGVAQCVQDLSLSDCQDCLAEASGRLRLECETSSWGGMYLGKCYIQYASDGNLNPVDNNANLNPTSNKRSGKGSKNNNLKWIIGISTFLGGAVSTIGVTFACKKCCNINAFNHTETTNLTMEKEAEKKGKEAAIEQAKELKDKLKKKEDEEKIRSVLPMQPYPYLPMPPPYPYAPQPSPNMCYYL